MNRCPMVSSVDSREQCREPEGHPCCSPNRFHRFTGPVGDTEKRLAHAAWWNHTGCCGVCRPLLKDGEMCKEGERLWTAMEAHGCTWKSWCALKDGHGLDCVALDELPATPPTPKEPGSRESEKP
jgi:hypothetical protein